MVLPETSTEYLKIGTGADHTAPVLVLRLTKGLYRGKDRKDPPLDIVHMQTFVAVIEENGFTAAARRLGVAKSVCSRRISELETDLGAQLVQRSTRSVVATDVGREYYESCLDIIGRIEAANFNAKCSTEVVSGRLRLSLPLNYSEDVIGPVLEQFVLDHPNVQLVLHFSDKREELISGGFDAALRIGKLEDSSLISRKISSMKAICCASPSYLEKHGSPKTVEDLSGHVCLTYTNLPSGTEWLFYKDGEEFRKRVPSIFGSNNGKFNRSMAIRGLGIVAMPDFSAKEAIENGELVPILTDFELPGADIQIVFPKKRNMRASLRAFIDYMQKNLS